MYIKLTRGDDRQIAGAVYSAGLPYDLSGSTLWFTAKRNLGDADAAAIIRLSSGALGGILIDGAAAGTFIISIAAGLTSVLPDIEQTELRYDLQLRNASGAIQTLSKGRLVVECDITETTTP